MLLNKKLYLCRQKKEYTDMNTHSYSTAIPPIEALWSLFMSQPKNVRRAFTQRVLAEDVKAEEERNRLLVKHSLTQAFTELHEAQAKRTPLPNARNLFK